MSTSCFKWTSKATHFDLYCRNNSTYFVDPPILWLRLCYNCQTDENYLIDGCGVLWEQSVCFISLYIFSPLICNLWSFLSVVKIDMHKINSSVFDVQRLLKWGFMIHVKSFPAVSRISHTCVQWNTMCTPIPPCSSPHTPRHTCPTSCLSFTIH